MNCGMAESYDLSSVGLSGSAQSEASPLLPEDGNDSLSTEKEKAFRLIESEGFSGWAV